MFLSGRGTAPERMGGRLSLIAGALLVLGLFASGCTSDVPAKPVATPAGKNAAGPVAQRHAKLTPAPQPVVAVAAQQPAKANPPVQPVAAPAAQRQTKAVPSDLPVATATDGQVAAATPDEPKFAVRPYDPPAKPQVTLPASPGVTAPAPNAAAGVESPVPPEGLVRYDSVIVGPENLPDVSEVDPSLPINMNTEAGEAEWIEEIKKTMHDQARAVVPRGADVGPEVDLSGPGIPPSRLVPAGAPQSGMTPDSIGGTGISFAGYPVANPSGVPPDVSITVGKDYAIAGYNSYYHVYNKATGASAGSFNMSTLFTGLPGCGSASFTLCDPQVAYDDFNGGSCPSPTDPRYILVALAANASNDSRICIAVSKSGLTPTSTANFWTYEFDPAGTGLADYEKIAIAPDALVMGYNWFGTGTGAGAAISKTELYNHTAPVTKEVTFTGTYTPWPAVRVGCKQAQTPTYSGTHFVSYSGSSLQLWRWPTPTITNGPSTYGGLQLTATGCTNPSGANILASGTGCSTCTSIDCFAGPWMDAEQRGDFLYAIRNATGGAGSAIQYAKINVGGASPSVFTNGTVSEAGNFLWMGSIASDRNYDFAIGYTRASQTNNIKAGASVVGNESLVWSAPVVQVNGVDVYNEGGSTVAGEYRWGDYNGFAPDPEDGCTMWANTQYSKDSAYSEDDATWIATWKLSGCSAAPQAFLDRPAYTCVQPVKGSIIDLGGTPTNAVYHSTTGGNYPAAISGGPNNYTVTPVTISQLGAADGDSVWLTFTGSDAASHSSSLGVVGCAVNLCVVGVDTPTGGCDNDEYLDTGEVINLFVTFKNNETFKLPTGFMADLRVDPAFPDANVTIVNGTATWDALDVGASAEAVGIPFQVKVTGGTSIRTINFEIYNIRATDGSWTGGSGCGAGNLKFTEIANANNTVGASFTNFPESFDSTTFPPTGWSQVDVVGTALNWARSTNTSHPTGGGTHSGAGLAFANSWTDATTGDQVRLQRTVDTNLSANPLAVVTFWMFHETQYATSADSAQVQVSTNGGTVWTSVGPAFSRPNLYGGANKSWQQHVVNVSSVAGSQATVRVGLLATTQYGNDIHVDDVNFASMSRVADASSCPAGAPSIALFDTDYGYGYFLVDPQCNANYYADAGESGTLLVYLSNNGTANADGVVATLTCPTCPAGVQICKSTANYGTIPFGSGYSYSQPDNGFEVAIPSGLAAGTALPWVVSVTATNPYSTTINIPTAPAGQSRSGTYTWIDNGDPNAFSIADYFNTAPGTAGATGRYGFTTAWTTQGTITNPNNTTIGGPVCRFTGKSATSPAFINHTFSTVGIDGDFRVLWYFNMGRAATDSLFFFEWDNNDGTGYRNFIPGGAGLAGQGGAADNWTYYGYYSLYWITYNSTATGYGPTAANAMLNNANMRVRFRTTWAGNTNTYWEVWPMWIDEFKWQNTATTCTGGCLPPEAATINEVRDVNACALTGVQVYFDKGVNTVSTALYKDGVSAVPSYTSGATYSPGDSSSHTYTIRATNTIGNTDSPGLAGVDAVSTGQYFTCTPGTCTNTTSVLLTAPSGQSAYQWYGPSGLIGGATTNTYTATSSGSYYIVYKAGACTAASPAQTITITVSGPTPKPTSDKLTATPMKAVKNGSNIDVTWDNSSCGGTSANYNLYYGALPLASATQAFTGSSCALGTTGSKTNVVVPADTWWIITGVSGTTASDKWAIFGYDSTPASEAFSGASGKCVQTGGQDTSVVCP